MLPQEIYVIERRAVRQVLFHLSPKGFTAAFQAHELSFFLRVDRVEDLVFRSLKSVF